MTKFEHPDRQSPVWADRYSYAGNKQGWYSCSSRLLARGRMQTICILIQITILVIWMGQNKEHRGFSSEGNSWQSRGEDDHVYFWENMDFLRTHQVSTEPSLRDNTDIGYLRRGVWEWTQQSSWGQGNGWRKGKMYR